MQQLVVFRRLFEAEQRLLDLIEDLVRLADEGVDELLAIDVVEPEFAHRQISLLNAQPVPVWKRSLRPRRPPVCSAVMAMPCFCRTCARHGGVLIADRLPRRGAAAEDRRAADDLRHMPLRRGAGRDHLVDQPLDGDVAVAKVGLSAHRIARQQVVIDAGDARLSSHRQTAMHEPRIVDTSSGWLAVKTWPG